MLFKFNDAHVNTLFELNSVDIQFQKCLSIPLLGDAHKRIHSYGVVQEVV